MNIKLLRDCAIVPTRGSEHAAGYDLYAATGLGETVIEPGQRVLVGTGIALEIPEGTFGGIFARSGLAFKEGLRPSNCVGVVDSDYRGEIMVALTNDSSEPKIITDGTRIAQLIIVPYYFIADWNVVNDLSDTSRGEGGFGSTGK